MLRKSLEFTGFKKGLSIKIFGSKKPFNVVKAFLKFLDFINYLYYRYEYNENSR